MAFKWKKVVRKVLAGKNEGKEMYYATVSCRESLSQDQLFDYISSWTGVSKADLIRVVCLLKDEIIRKTCDGYCVKIDGLGSFRLNFSSKGRTTSDEVTLQSFSTPKLLFIPSRKLQRRLDSLTPKRTGDGKMALR